MITNAAHGPIMGEYAKQAKDDYSVQNQKQQWSANIHGMIWGDGGNQGEYPSEMNNTHSYKHFSNIFFLGSLAN